MQPDPYRTGPRLAALTLTIGAVVALWTAIHQPVRAIEAGPSASATAHEATASGSMPDGTLPSTSSAPTIGAGTDVDRSPEPAEVELVALVAVRFTQGWLESDPVRRRELLTETATSGLAAQLCATAGYKVPRLTLAAAPVEVLGMSETSADVVVGFTDTSGLRLDLVLTPGSRRGWLVASLTPVESRSR